MQGNKNTDLIESNGISDLVATFSLLVHTLKDLWSCGQDGLVAVELPAPAAQHDVGKLWVLEEAAQVVG